MPMVFVGRVVQERKVQRAVIWGTCHLVAVLRSVAACGMGAGDVAGSLALRVGAGAEGTRAHTWQRRGAGCQRW